MFAVTLILVYARMLINDKEQAAVHYSIHCSTFDSRTDLHFDAFLMILAVNYQLVLEKM